MATQPHDHFDSEHPDVPRDRIPPPVGQSISSSRSSYELQPLGTVEKSSSKPSWRSLFVFTTRQDALPIICAGVVTLASGLLKPIAAIFYGKLFAILTRFGGGTLGAKDTLHEISKWCIALVILAVGAWVFEGAFLLSWIIYGELQAKNARQQLFTGMLDKDMEWYDLREDGTGSLLIRIQTQIRELQLAVSQPLGLLFFEIVGAFASLGVAFFFSWKLTLVILASFPIATILLYLTSIGLGSAIEDQKRELNRASKYANTAVTHISTVKAFCAQDHEIWQYCSTIQRVTTYYLKQARANALQFGVTRFFMVAIFVQGFWYGSYLVHNGLNPGNVLTTFYSALSAFLAIETILPQWLVLAKGMSAGETLKSMLDQMRRGRDITVVGGSLKPATCTGDIEINNVSFAYPSNKHQLVLNNANLFFPSGETTFLVGTSGSGKSTVGNLVMKYYEPLFGEILIDGNTIQTLDTDWVRNNITLVQQDNVLFNETIFQNIAFGKQDGATHDEVIKASETACLQHTIQAIPKGIDTVVGANGIALSGGQSQRVAIARAKLRDSPILILDESTSALDQRGRIEVMDKIREWRRGKTTIILTHDLSQIQDEDYVYVLEKSRVVHEGYKKKLERKYQGTFATILQEEAEFSQRRRNSEPTSPVPSTPDTPDFHERWGNISKIFSVHDPPSDPFPHLTMRSPRMSLGVAFAQANALRSEYIWSIPVIPESSEIEHPDRTSWEFSSPRPEPPSRLSSFSSPREAPRTPPPAMVRNDGAHPSMGPERHEHAEVEQLTAKRSHPRAPISLTKIFSTIWPTISWRERTVLLFGFLTAMIVGASTPAFAFVFANLLNTFYIPENQASEAKKWALILLGIAIVDGMASLCSHYALEHSGQAWINAIRLKALNRILLQPKSWFDIEHNSPGRLNDCLDRKAEEMRNLVGRFAGIVLTVAVMMSISIIWAFVISWRLTLVTLACGPVVYVVARSFNFVSGKWEHRCNDAADRTSSIFAETFSNIRVVRALTLEHYFEKKHERSTIDTYRIGIRRAFYSGLLYGSTDSMSFFISALVYYYSTSLTTKEFNSVSEIITVVNLLLLGIANASASLALVPQINSSRTTATEMLYLASLPLDDSHETQGTTRLATPLPIQMNNLSFTYPNQSPHKALDRLSLTIDSGTCTAIVGPSGSGKSTLASIFLGLYPPDHDPEPSRSPPLNFNGKASHSCNITTHRSLVSIVPQKPLLFPSTIFDNITYGLPEMSSYRNSRAAKEAAMQAGIHNFIASLERGYDTTVGDGGMGLSGGQAQRIAIARALIRHPKVLILDEATSALDGENAEGIREAIAQFVKVDTAVVMITHDVKMMQAADRIVVVENGRIVEVGGFGKLKRAGGAFTVLLGGERQGVGFGLGLEATNLSPVSPVKPRSRETWMRKFSL